MITNSGADLSYAPVLSRWLRGLEASMPADIVIQLVADTMAACERTMIQGDAQFLLCHHHPTASTTLEAGQFLSVPVGADVLLPVSAPIEPGDPLPRHSLPGTPDAPVTHLAYRTESGMGRITASALAAGGSPVWLKPVFSSHLATLLVTMAIEGRGVSWSPRSLVADALAAGPWCGPAAKNGTSRWKSACSAPAPGNPRRRSGSGRWSRRAWPGERLAPERLLRRLLLAEDADLRQVDDAAVADGEVEVAQAFAVHYGLDRDAVQVHLHPGAGADGVDAEHLAGVRNIVAVGPGQFHVVRADEGDRRAVAAQMGAGEGLGVPGRRATPSWTSTSNRLTLPRKS